MKHELKTDSLHFEYLLSGEKTFEIRKNDRSFNVGDEVVLKEWDQGSDDMMGYTGQEIEGVITYLTDFAQENGYVVFAFKETRRTQ